MRKTLAAVGLAVVALVASACNVPKRYDVNVVAEGLDHPWDAAFTPDGSLLFTERVGRINVRRAGAQTTFAGLPADAVESGEGGMMGIAVDPAFDTNRRIYTCFLSNISGVLDVRVVRFEVSADWTTLVDRADLVPGIPATSGRHSGCRTRFGPDGHLYVTTGDAASNGVSQSLSSLGGKVLRITTDGGAVAGNINDGIIYAYGFRNPQGISWRPTDNQPFLIEHGPGCDDEITPLAPGGNGGWNPNGVGAYNENVPMTDFNLPNVLAPAWSSGCPTMAPSGGTFVTTDDWGFYDNFLAVAMLKDQHLRLIDMKDGTTDRGGSIISGQGRVRVAVEGLDGLLYILTDEENGRILTVDPVQ